MDKVYIIAEVGANHNGDLQLSLKMVDEIVKTGVDAIKFQMYNPLELYSADAIMARYQKENVDTESILEMSRSHQLQPDEHLTLYKRCKELGVDYICTAFDMESMLFLENNCDMAYYKIASGEIYSLDILQYIANHRKPIIMSTGMTDYDTISVILKIINEKVKQDITILHCISNYPAEYDEVNLRNMLEIQKRFGCRIGFSDHTIGNECAIAAVAIGATMIEKHVTLDKTLPGPDHKASIDIPELKSLVDSIRHIEVALGSYERSFTDAQKEVARVARKSIVAKRDIKAGDIIKADDICYKRPGTGFSPLELDKVIGKIAATNIKANRVIFKENISN